MTYGGMMKSSCLIDVAAMVYGDDLEENQCGTTIL